MVMTSYSLHKAEYFIKAIEDFFRVYIASPKHSGRGGGGGKENSCKLYKPTTASRVCTTVSNSPNPPRV